VSSRWQWEPRFSAPDRCPGTLDATDPSRSGSPSSNAKPIHRGTFSSVRDLNAKIRAFIDGWNDRAHPFTWTKTADQILKKANRKKTSDARH
jgi:hypothetical protein